MCTIVSAALAGVPRAPVDDVVDFYVAALREADTSLLDSAGQKPQYRCAAAALCRCWAASVMTHNGAQWRPLRAPCAALPTLSNILRSSARRTRALLGALPCHRLCCSTYVAAAWPLRSLRTLSRALEYARAAMPIYGVQRALLDGLSMVRLCRLATRSRRPKDSKSNPKPLCGLYRNLA